jgi:hypothetical protein
LYKGEREVKKSVEDEIDEVCTSHNRAHGNSSFFHKCLGWLSMAGRLPSLALNLWKGLADYSGRFAHFAKALHVVGLLLAVTFPYWSFPLYLWLAVLAGYPWNILCLIAFLAQSFAVLIVQAAITYKP